MDFPGYGLPENANDPNGKLHRITSRRSTRGFGTTRIPGDSLPGNDHKGLTVGGCREPVILVNPRNYPEQLPGLPGAARS